MSRPNFGYWAGRDFFFDTPSNHANQDPTPPACLFHLRRYTLTVAALTRDISWSAGQFSTRMRLSGLASFNGEGIRITGPTENEHTTLEAIWITLAAASERSARNDHRGDYSMLDITCPPLRSQGGLQSELKLFIDVAKLVELDNHFEVGHGELRIHFMTEVEDDIHLAPGKTRIAIPVYDAGFQLLQNTLPERSAPPVIPPKLQHTLQHCLPLEIGDDTPIARIGRELATSLGSVLSRSPRGIDQENNARNELARWLRDVRTTFRDDAEKPRAPSSGNLEHLAQRYCRNPSLHAPTLEWCLIDAMLHTTLTEAAARIEHRSTRILREIALQSALFAIAWLIARDNAPLLGIGLLALNLLRLNLPRPQSSRAAEHTQLDALRRAYDQLAQGEDGSLNTQQLRTDLARLQTSGLRLPASLDRLLAKRLARENTSQRAGPFRLAA